MSESTTPMHCPKCHAAMHPLEGLGEAIVHRCRGCEGMWFEMMAHEDLRAHAERIDLNAPKAAVIDAAHDPAAPAGATLLCPACTHYPLIHMVDPHQPHLHFESCKFCYGRFYDAGEFRDYVDDSEYDTPFDRLFKAVAGKRAN